MDQIVGDRSFLDRRVGQIAADAAGDHIGLEIRAITNAWRKIRFDAFEIVGNEVAAIARSTEPHETMLGGAGVKPIDQIEHGLFFGSLADREAQLEAEITTEPHKITFPCGSAEDAVFHAFDLDGSTPIKRLC